MEPNEERKERKDPGMATQAGVGATPGETESEELKAYVDAHMERDEGKEERDAQRDA